MVMVVTPLLCSLNKGAFTFSSSQTKPCLLHDGSVQPVDPFTGDTDSSAYAPYLP